MPTNPKTRKLWATFCNTDWEDTRPKLVCSKHFEKSAFRFIPRRNTAVPTLYLNNAPTIDKPDQLVSVTDIIKVRKYHKLLDDQFLNIKFRRLKMNM